MRTYGAYDLKKRKERSDKGKLRKTYCGKPTRKKKLKNGRFVPYIPNRRRGDPVRIWFWQRLPMSKKGYLRWNTKVRKHIRTTITRFVDRPIDVDTKRLSNPEQIESLALEVCQFPGSFILMMPTHAKNRNHVSYKPKARVKIIQTDGHLICKVSRYSGLKRYWFWRGD